MDSKRFDPDSLRVSDLPRLEAEPAAGESSGRSTRILSTQRRLQSLLDASRLVVSDLDLEQVLRRIAESARSLANAEFAALGVIGADGRLEQFIHVGMSAQDVEQIGHLPEGHGVLGAVIDSGEPIRLLDLNADPRAVGFPARHPPMDSFLGVPIKIREQIFGNLYLTNRAEGPFTEEDEQLLTGLAATAATAINNARLYGEARRAERLSAALNDVTAALLASEASDVFGVIAQRASVLLGADFTAIVTSKAAGAQFFVEAAHGEGASDAEGRVLPRVDCVLSRAMSGVPEISASDDPESLPFGDLVPCASVIAVALEVSGEHVGAICAARAEDQTPYTSGDLELMSEFATQAGLAVALAWARADRQRLTVIEDRARTARDLHDHVIQRLFGTGLGLQAFASAHPTHADAIDAHVTEIDAAITDIRNAIFTLRSRNTPTATRHHILEAITEASTGLAAAPQIRFSGPIDLCITGELTDDVVAVVREALANVARHARADSVCVEITVTPTEVTVVIEDDGIGPAAGEVEPGGTENLRTRARRRGGSFELSRLDSDRTRARWRVPLSTESDR